MTPGWDRELIQAYIDFDAAYRREQGEREPDRAVCDACGWEGTEDDVEHHGDGTTGDSCPQCGQLDINYYFGGQCEHHE